MNNTFVEEIRNAVSNALQDKEVEVREVEKTNGVMSTGVSIRTEGCNIAPTLYIDEDKTVEENVDYILNAYNHCQLPAPFDMEWFSDYEQVKDKLSVMITSKPISGLVKRKAPGFDDLYMQAYVVVDNNVIGRGSIKVTEEHMKQWGVSNAKLFADALMSAPNVSPAKLNNMFDTLTEMGAPMPMPAEFGGADFMNVLTNKENVMGASAILYTKVKENTYMIPSSVHEVILLDGEQVEPFLLNAIIDDVNRTCLKPEEFLSNHAYRFNGKKWENVE